MLSQNLEEYALSKPKLESNDALVYCADSGIAGDEILSVREAKELLGRAPALDPSRSSGCWFLSWAPVEG